MKRIITDTNIWYNISNDQIIEISKKHKLVVPIIIINELYTSRNLWISERTFNELKRAIDNIIDNVSNIEFIEFDPFEFLVKAIDTSILPRLNLHGYLNEFKALSKLTYEDVQKIRPDRGDISKLTNFINEKSIEYKKLIDSNKQKFKKIDTRVYTESYILMLVNDNLQFLDNNYPLFQSLDKNKNELLINTFDDVLREVSKSSKKMKDNDWIDIFNLTYVSKEDLYWTKEKSKIKHIINSGCEDYLFDINNY